MATKSGSSGQHFAVRLDAPPPSDPTGGLDELTTTTAALKRRLDSLEKRNQAVQATVDRIKGIRR